MYIKSRSLLPRQEQPADEDAEEDDPRWELIRQLIEYKKFKDAAGFLQLREAEQEGRFAFQPDLDHKPADDPAPLADVSIFDLIRAFQNVLRRFEESHDLGDIHRRPFHRFRQDRISARALHAWRVQPIRAAFRWRLPTKAEVIVTFLALLELMKLNQFVVRQSHLLGDIEIERRGPHTHVSAGGARLKRVICPMR